MKATRSILFASLMALTSSLTSCAKEEPVDTQNIDDKQTISQTATPGLPVYRKTTEKSFEDVIFELEFAITEKNYRITGRNTIGSALRKRGYDDFPDAEVIHFCSLERARLVLQYDLDYLAQMPCRVTVHVENERTVIHGIMLPTDHAITEVNAFAKETNQIIRDIVDFAVSE